jgi:L-threonylcarbamoyladenylate synthase
MTLLLDCKTQLSWAVDFLKKGNPVALPTETVYGLAASAYQPEALGRVFQLKARPFFDPLIVHTLSTKRLPYFCKPIDAVILDVIEKLWPGPLTVLLEKKPDILPDICTSGSPWVAVRSPRHPVFREVLELFGQELAAPSANRFGHVSPVTAIDCVRELGSYGLEAVVEGGRANLGIESTIVRFDVNSKKVFVLRYGACSSENILNVLGNDWLIEDSTVTKKHQVQSGLGLESPGQLESHYAPKTKKVFAVESYGEVLDLVEAQCWNPQKVLLVTVFKDFNVEKQKWSQVRVLSQKSDSLEAASNLFFTMRELDETVSSEISQNIVFILPPKNDIGLNLAIRDRIQRASVKTISVTPMKVF